MRLKKTSLNTELANQFFLVCAVQEGSLNVLVSNDYPQCRNRHEVCMSGCNRDNSIFIFYRFLNFIVIIYGLFRMTVFWKYNIELTRYIYFYYMCFFL